MTYVHNEGSSMNHTEASSIHRITPRKWIVRQTTSKPPLRIALGSFVLWGRGPLLHLKVVELLRDGTYLTFPDGAELSNGGVFYIVRPLISCHGSYLFSGKPRKVVATVQVVRTTSDTRALVTILSGSLLEGMSAEKAVR